MLLCYEDYAFEVIAHKIDTKKSRGDNSMMTQESVDEDFTEEKNQEQYSMGSQELIDNSLVTDWMRERKDDVLNDFKEQT